MAKEGKLSDLPNIGPELEKRLKLAGIHTPDELRHLGAENAFLRLHIIDPDACFNMMCALEGAVQGIRWHYLSEESKEKIRSFLKSIARINS